MPGCALSVIVPARDAQATIAATLDGLARQRVAGGYEVLVVDNGSRDETVEVALAAGVRVIERKRGDGPGPARNQGALEARASRLAFIDADCVPVPGWLAAGQRCLEEAAVVQGQVAPPPGVDVGPFDRTLWVNRLTGLFETANLFVTREAFTAAEGFGAGLEAPGEAPFGEDVLFGWRAVRAGHRAAYCPQALVHHHVFTRSASGYLAERRRLAMFPPLARQVPELRETLLYRRCFMSKRGAYWDLGLVAALAALTGRRWALLGCVPYLAELTRAALAQGRRSAPVTAAVLAAGDAIAARALVAGSLRARNPVL
ncbi:MAG TPA: glycosyltransferase [Solirubrobacteraceae bacterium]|jgi:glycosyltransferase involved in cell wall biosynthesis|nr:glycosyltransferase [Solirubrobacteraceae bacterium]